MDIAEIGFRVDTAQLEKGSKDLDALKNAAAGMSKAARQLSTAIEGMNSSLMNSARVMSQLEVLKARSLLASLKARKDATAEEIKAAQNLLRYATAVENSISKDMKRVKTLNDVAMAQRKVETATKAANAAQADTPVARPRPSLAVNNGPTIPRDMMPNRFNTGNLAAQFQDIGVTASMGMSPMLIAIQQGTQLSAILNSMEKPLSGLAIAFRSVFNAVSLGSIALVAGVAALIQYVNWTKVAQNVLMGLANAAEVAMPYILALAGALVLFYSPAILAGLASLVQYITYVGIAALAAAGKMVLAWAAASLPITILIAGIAAVGIAFQMMGVDVLAYMKSAANGTIGLFVGAFNAIVELWKTFPAILGDFMVQAANGILAVITKVINGFLAGINYLISQLPAEWRPKGGKLSVDLEFKNPLEGQAAAAGAKAGKAFTDAFYNTDFVGKGVAKANQIGKAVAGSLRGLAGGLDSIGADGKAGKGAAEKKDPYEEIVSGAQRRIAVMKAEQKAIGMTEVATARLKYETELLNQASEKGIKLSPQQRAALLGLADDMANVEEQTRRTKAALDFVKEGARGFFQDIKQGLQEGKGLWESFGNAVTNVIDKILNKIMDSGVEMLFDGLFSGGSSGGGASFLSEIGSFLFSAKGNAFNHAGLVPFAKGGAFTNNIVDRPTPFAFASGGAFGVMGESGAEAIMPLHRGSDGSLGVKVNGGGGGTAVILNINNYGDSKISTQQRQTSNGLEIDVMVDQVVSQKISEQGSSTNRSLNSRDNRRLISR